MRTTRPSPSGRHLGTRSRMTLAPLVAAACAFWCANAATAFEALPPGAASAPPASAAAEDARGATPLVLAGAGPYYTLKLPLALQAAAGRADLADLRVRNAAGAAMPLAWVPPPETLDLVQRAPVALYRVPVANSGASAAALGASTPAAAAPSWIVDTHDGESDLVRLDLTLAPGAQGVFGLRIEASDDLQAWREVRPAAQVVQLQQLPLVGGGNVGLANEPRSAEHLMSTGIDLDGVPARYLRLTALSTSAPPPLADATVTRTRRQAAPMPLEWSAPIAPTSCEENSCDYPLPPNLAIDALQIDLADPDTVGRVAVMGRVDDRYVPVREHRLLRGPLHALHLKAERTPPVAAYWDTLASENAYRLAQPGGAPDLRSPPLRLSGQRWQVLRLATEGAISQLGHVPPTLRVAVRPRVLVFLARGAGPFRLERATAPADLAPAPMTLAELMPTRAAPDPLPAATATPVIAADAAPPAALAPPSHPAARPAPGHTPWLWAALLIGLALMAAMAWTLLRKPPAPDPMGEIDL